MKIQKKVFEVEIDKLYFVVEMMVGGMNSKNNYTATVMVTGYTKQELPYTNCRLLEQLNTCSGYVGAYAYTGKTQQGAMSKAQRYVMNDLKLIDKELKRRKKQLPHTEGGVK